ncbi:glutamate--tRNA ligase family protein [Pontibacter sp. H249]|uniref:glutamate--tRNA ligase family protein n=1 Tax=Pontibacter sp. H249 TaxID=3133420 RepID=UPI0030C05A6F
MQLTATTSATVKTRIAPTPSGYLHLGNAMSFAITWALARKSQGTVVLRIDDIDNTRFRPEYLQDIFDTLDFMGIDYDEGPRTPLEFEQHYSQHLRLPQYEDLLNLLAEKNRVYACPCSRSQIAAVSPEGLYPRTCRDVQLPLEAPEAAWRVRIPDDTVIGFRDQLLGNCAVALALEMPDFVVRRKDRIPSYQIVSLCDDLQTGINLVVRGEDLMLSTAAQLFLAEQVGATAFTNAQFVHHPIILTSEGNKLSKSDDALSINEMRQAGLKTKDLWQKIATTLGWEDECITDAASFLKSFKLENLPHHISKV